MVSKTKRLLNVMKKEEVRTPIGTEIYLPNYSVVKGASNLGTVGSVLFLGASRQIEENNSEFFWDNTNNRLGIGTSSPEDVLHVVSTGGNTVPFLVVSSGGNKMFETVEVAGGHTIFRQRDSVNAVTNVFQTGGNSYINGGNFSVGTTTSSAQMHVDQSSTTGAEPVLLLDQADVSEEFIRFDATEAVGNSVEDVGSKTLTVTKFLRININGTNLYIQAGTIA